MLNSLKFLANALTIASKGVSTFGVALLLLGLSTIAEGCAQSAPEAATAESLSPARSAQPSPTPQIKSCPQTQLYFYEETPTQLPSKCVLKSTFYFDSILGTLEPTVAEISKSKHRQIYIPKAKIG